MKRCRRDRDKLGKTRVGGSFNSVCNSCIQETVRSSSATDAADTRTLGKPKSSQATLQNGHRGHAIKAALKGDSDWKKSKLVDEVNISVKVGEHCAEGVQQFCMFGTPGRYICPAGRNGASERSRAS